jgi:hypothetical protein
MRLPVNATVEELLIVGGNSAVPNDEKAEVSAIVHRSLPSPAKIPVVPSVVVALKTTTPSSLSLGQHANVVNPEASAIGVNL